MKIKLTPLLAAVCLAVGCAHFKTRQVNNTYDPKTGNLLTKTTTTAGASTVFDANSTLAKFHAMQSDKTQAATVGGLDQASTSAGVVAIINAAATAAGALSGSAAKAAVAP